MKLFDDYESYLDEDPLDIDPEYAMYGNISEKDRRLLDFVPENPMAEEMGYLEGDDYGEDIGDSEDMYEMEGEDSGMDTSNPAKGALTQMLLEKNQARRDRARDFQQKAMQANKDMF